MEKQDTQANGACVNTILKFNEIGRYFNTHKMKPFAFASKYL